MKTYKREQNFRKIKLKDVLLKDVIVYQKNILPKTY